MNIALEIGSAVWLTLTEMAPFLLFGFAVAGLLSVAVSQKTVERHMGGRGFLPVLKAAIVGVPLPLCSCGVIPVATSLRKHGASKGATAAFLISTPQTGIDSILVTYALLGPVFAVFRPVVAFLTGLAGGWLVDAVEPCDGDETAGKAAPKECREECCSHANGANWFMRAIRHGFVILPRDISRPLLVGLVGGGLIATILPQDFFGGSLGSGIWSMLAMMLLSIPLYVCTTASVPIAAALIMKGISPGAALVFLITGPATNVASIATIWKVLGRKTALVYLATVVVTALGAGIFLDRLMLILSVKDHYVSRCCMMPDWIGTVSAVLLLIVLGSALFRVEHKPTKNAP